MQEVGGSIPPGSTIYSPNSNEVQNCQHTEQQ